MAPPPKSKRTLAPPRRDASRSPEPLYSRHQALMQLYSASTRGARARSSSIGSSVAAPTANVVSAHDLQVLQRNFQFIRDDDTDAADGEKDWQVRMGVRYYRQLFREYALADLSRYEEGKIGLRWRTETEVVTGKGQFSCGNKRCNARTELRSYELLFAYVEHGEKKRCLVKVRTCATCAEKLFYKKLAELRLHTKKEQRKRGKEKRRLSDPNANAHSNKRKRTTSSDEFRNDDSSSVDSNDHPDSLAKGDILQLCDEINAQQKAKFQAHIPNPSDGQGQRCSDEFADLLP